jgi:hypothetical protein
LEGKVKEPSASVKTTGSGIIAILGFVLCPLLITEIKMPNRKANSFFI